MTAAKRLPVTLLRSLHQSRQPIQLQIQSRTRRAGFSSTTFHDGDLKNVRPLFDLTGKNFIVTGGGRGIGYAITRAIAEMGGNVAVLDVLGAPVKDFGTLEHDFGVKTRYLRADVTEEKSLTKGFEQSISELGSLDGWYVILKLTLGRRVGLLLCGSVR